MRKDDLISFSWIIVFWLYMYLVDYFVPAQYKPIAGIGGILIIVLMMVLQEMILTLKYSRYQLLKAYIFPYRQEAQLLIKDIESHTAQDGGGTLTILHLARPFKHPEYGRLDKIIISCDKPFFDSVVFKPKKNVLNIAGMVLDHPSVAYAVLHEVAVRDDHGKPYPIYKMVYGERLGSLVEVKRVGRQEVPESIRLELERLREENERLRQENAELHQKVIRLEMETIGLKNEVKALLRSVGIDPHKMAIEIMFAFRDRYGTIIEAAKRMGRKYHVTWSAVAKILSMVIVPAMIVGYLYYRPDIVMWMLQHPIHTAIIIGVIGVVIYYLSRRSRRR